MFSHVPSPMHSRIPGPVDPRLPRSINLNFSSFWGMDEAGTGNYNRVDSIGGIVLQSVGNVATAEGKVGNSAEFNSSNYLTTASTPTLQAGDIDFSLAAWVMFYGSLPDNSFIVSKRGAGDLTGAEYQILFSDVLFPTSNPTPQFTFAVFAGGSERYVTSAMPVNHFSINNWHFVVAWHDATNDQICLQVDNGSVATVSTGGPLQPASNRSFDVGYLPGIGLHLNGRVDALGYAKRIWTSEERSYLYNAGRGRQV